MENCFSGCRHRKSYVCELHKRSGWDQSIPGWNEQFRKRRCRSNCHTSWNTLRLKEFRVTQAIDDSDCLLLYCDYTNNSSSSSSALVDVQLSAKQNGEKLSPAVPKEDEPAIDNYITEVEPGSTVTVCYAFSLNDKSDVTLEASEAFAFGGGNVTSQTIKLQ